MQFTITKRLIIQLTIGLAMLFASITHAQVIEAPVNHESTVEETLPEITAKVEVPVKAKSTQEVIDEQFADTPILKKIAFCESRVRHFGADGRALRGHLNSQDIGVMQINEKYHLSTANRLGINIYTLQGNIDYAKYLYRTQGVRPWVHSSHCWDPSNTFALR